MLFPKSICVKRRALHHRRQSIAHYGGRYLRWNAALKASRQALSLRIQLAAVLNSSRNKRVKNPFFLEPR
jgi:hypothetical protein